MKKQRLGWLTGLAVFAVVPIALAGPPLVCFPLDVGNAASLPWAAAARGWNSPSATYDVRRLPDDTVALLDDKAPVIVRMETLRRAAIYGGSAAGAGRRLLKMLKGRIDQQVPGRTGALYLFDYGYLVETLKQVQLTNKKGAEAVPEDGYGWIVKALANAGGDPQMEFAAALVSLWPRQRGHDEHFRKALAGADADPLLASNLVGSAFADRGRTIAEMRKNSAARAN